MGTISNGESGSSVRTKLNDIVNKVEGNASIGNNIIITGVTTAATFEPNGDTAAGDNAAIGYTAAEGLILTGQGSTNDVTIKNDADADVLEIPTGTTNVSIAGNLGVGGTVTATGTSVFASLNISGDIDVDGTTNLDVVDIDGAVDFASTTAHAGNATFADNVKAIFGAGSLQIYHDGSHSYISEQGTGHLKVFAEHFFVNNAGDTEQMIGATVNGAVDLFFNGSKKLATTSTGIDVTGTITSDGLTVENGTSGIAVDTSVSLSPEIKPSQALSDLTLSATGGGGHLKFKTNSNERLRIDGNTGDISFYEDTGTTAKLFWDASAESLGIGCSPTVLLDLESASPIIRLTDSDASGTPECQISGAGGDLIFDADRDNEKASTLMSFKVDGSEAMQITATRDLLLGATTRTGGGRLELTGSGTGAYVPTGYNGNNVNSVRIASGGSPSTSDTVGISMGIGGGAEGYFGIVQDTAGYANFVFNSYNGSYAERMRITSAGLVGIGTDSPTSNGGGSATVLHIHDADANNWAVTHYTNGSTGSAAADGFIAGNIGSDVYLWNYESSPILFATNNSERMRLTATGDLLVSKTSVNSGVVGVEAKANGTLVATVDGDTVSLLNRKTSDGEILRLQKDGSAVGNISSRSGIHIQIQSAGDTAGLHFGGAEINPVKNQSISDNTIDLGQSNYRYSDIFATNGTIQTSDQNEKQDIAELTDAEQRVAVAAKGLLRKFRWKDAVAEKGDKARTHFGIIAQDLQAAFAAEGLDAGDYAMFISSTWTNEETGEEKTRMGIRYSELLAFIIAAI